MIWRRGRWAQAGPGGRRRVLPAAVIGVGLAVAVSMPGGVALGGPPTPHPVKKEYPVPFGRVIYRAVKAASFESLGVTVIACRHFDPEPRRFAVEFFDSYGRQVQTFGPHIAEAARGEKVVFVTDGKYFKGRDVWDVRLGHLTGGPARVVSDAEVVRCGGKIRFDGGWSHPSHWRGIGFHREGEPSPGKPDWSG